MPAPLGGAERGKNLPDRARSGAKIHILVDERGAPLSIHITGANQHDKWSLDEWVIPIAIKRPHCEQHRCAEKGYDTADIHALVKEQRCLPHIQHRRRRNEPKIEQCPILGEMNYPARRWVVERTLGWLAKRRSIKIRWSKKTRKLAGFSQTRFGSYPPRDNFGIGF